MSYLQAAFSDQLEPQKMIYFPMKGQRERMPYVVYVTRLFRDPLGVDEWKGMTDLEELKDGRFAWYRASRCRPFSVELMQACEEWNSRRLQVEKDFETLLKKGRV